MIRNVCVVMPAYNAGATIEGVFARVPVAAQARITRYIVVDDGSTDDTAAALDRLHAQIPQLVILRHATNRGYGAAEKTLLDQAVREEADVAIVLHADGQYSPESIPDLLMPFDRDEADIVQGSRMARAGALAGGMPLYKYVANRGLTALANWTLGMKLSEYYSGYMLYNRAALRAIPYHRLADAFHFDLQMLVMARVRHLRIRQVPIPTIYAGERSQLRPIRYGLDVLSVLSAYRRGDYHVL
jgi:glycosyltransferase involved in cell wall biosynthesis